MVARELLGAYVIRTYQDQQLVGMIIETEAYQGGDDPASHAYGGKTVRNAPMFGPCGYSYVYFTYGKHFCFNIVARAPDQKAGAVLIRSVLPINGIEIMKQLRGNNTIADGPAKFTQAFAIDRFLNSHDLTKPGELYIAQNMAQELRLVIAAHRVGINKAQKKLWRFYF